MFKLKVFINIISKSFSLSNIIQPMYLKVKNYNGYQPLNIKIQYNHFNIYFDI